MPDLPRILVVEDDPVNLLVLTRMLRRLGHEADIAKNGREAVEATAKVAYDIIFMDLMMPELDGIQAARQIRSSPNGSGPTIFAVTANVMPEIRAACMDAGMDDYVTKPIQLDTIRGLLADSRGSTPPDSADSTPESTFLNRQTLAELQEMMGDEDFFAELLCEFVKDSNLLLNDMGSALQSDRMDEVSRAAHTLKSTAATFGGVGLTQAAIGAEQAARRGDRAALRGLLSTLVHERKRLCEALIPSADSRA
ncbi:MAG: CheY-like chemotaxis protein [Rhodothermales bacterium]|jgi:CheY-like chemotaxis protein